MRVVLRDRTGQVVFSATARTIRGLNEAQRKALREARARLQANNGHKEPEPATYSPRLLSETGASWEALRDV